MLVYPSLEDMVVDQTMRASLAQPSAPQLAGSRADTVSVRSLDYPSLYPSLNEEATSSKETSASTPFLNHSISYDERGPLLERPNLPALSYSVSSLVAPITGLAPGFEQANLHHGVRNIYVPKAHDGKIGMRLTEIDRGLFVQFVLKESPAAHQGLRFADQILQIGGKEVFGLGNAKAMQLIEKVPLTEGVLMVVRDRPFCRVITLHKDENGKLGFTHRDNKINAVTPDSSASKNGVTINQAIVEVDGISVIAYCTAEVAQVLENAPRTVSLTVMPWDKYEKLVYKIDSKLLRQQDHSVPASAYNQFQ
ncbi:unnamed protein product, partial [Mesorhabditis spiculigera]